MASLSKNHKKYPCQPFFGSSSEVLAHEYKYHGMWWGKNSLFWLLNLLEEFIELALSLAGLHRHPPEYELMQIASICIGWMDCIKAKRHEYGIIVRKP